MKSFIEFNLDEAISKKPKPPVAHKKKLTHDALPIITTASVDVSDFLESTGNGDLNREWLKLTSDAQLALFALTDFLDKKLPKGK